MPSFKRLTIEEARTLSREELLPRIEEEQKYWYHRIHHCDIHPGDEKAFSTFNDILHITVNGRRFHADMEAALDGGTLDRDYWTRPLGELGEL